MERQVRSNIRPSWEDQPLKDLNAKIRTDKWKTNHGLARRIWERS